MKFIFGHFSRKSLMGFSQNISKPYQEVRLYNLLIFVDEKNYRELTYDLF